MTDNTLDKKPCIICGELTEHYCPNCADDEMKLYYCDKHYNSVVLTGNCCRESEEIYA